MTRTFTVAIMAAIMYVFYRNGNHGGFDTCAEDARRLYDEVRKKTE